MTERRSSSHLAAVLVPFAALLLYVRTAGYEYVWDDLTFLAGFQQYQGLQGAIRSFAEPFYLYAHYYRPLATFSFVLSNEPSVQHGINVALHAFNTALVFYLARALMPQEVAKSRAGLVAAALGALIFAVHPVGVESTAWVSGRFDTLMCCFTLGTCLVALSDGIPQGRRLLGVFLLFACAMGCKESAVGLPVALPFLLLLKWRLAGQDVQQVAKVHGITLMRLLAALTLALALYIAARLAVTHTLLSGATPLKFGGSGFGLLDKINIVAAAIVEMALLIVAPLSHSAPLHPFKYEAGSGVLAGTLVVAVSVLALLVLVLVKKSRLNFPLALLAALAMAWPVLHILGIPNRDNIISDRYALAPLALLLAALTAVAGAWIVRRVPELGARGKRIPLYAGAACLLWAGVLAAYSSATIPLWRDEASFWQFMYKQVPSSVYAHNGYIRVLMEQERWDEARAEVDAFDKQHPAGVLEIEDGMNWMVVLDKTGDREKALAMFQMLEADMERSGVPARKRSELYGARAAMEADAGDWGLAARYYEQAVQLAPANTRFSFQYARALYMAGQAERAKEMFERTLADVSPQVAERARKWRAGWD